MDDLTVRVLVVASILVVVLLSALVARRFGSPQHHPVNVDGLGLPAGIVIFTSTTCENCRGALGRVKATGAPVREVTHEIEPGKFEAAGVTGVPLVLIIDDSGTVVDQIAGVPRVSRLQRSLRRAAF